VSAKGEVADYGLIGGPVQDSERVVSNVDRYFVMVAPAWSLPNPGKSSTGFGERVQIAACEMKRSWILIYLFYNIVI
jgi:hypothetical protein